MEEILASIRRIISEDDAPAAAAPAAPTPAPAPAPVVEPEPERLVAAEPPSLADDDDGVLELTDRVEPAPAPAPPPEPEPRADLDFRLPPREPEPRPAPSFREEAPVWPARSDEPLVSGSAAEQASTAFSQLARSLAMPQGGRSLEDVVQELLRPLLKEWLDAHLADIVQAKVEAEVERIARGRVR
ncbi:MAG: DUF2497 domain-containing protein [Caulobacteraceae bacterium]